MAPGVDKTQSPDKDLVQKERVLLRKYAGFLDSFLKALESQVTALHALQVFCYSQSFPKGMLRRWFVALYEFGIIEEDAFSKWREDVTDAYPGKGEALFQVRRKLYR